MIDADRTLTVLGVDVSTLTPGSHKPTIRRESDFESFFNAIIQGGDPDGRSTN